LIVISFQQQYGIDLYNYPFLRVAQYYTLISGCSRETPLGYYMSTRAEKDIKTIRKMTKEEKKIRTEWQGFISAKSGNPKLKDASEDFSALFGNLRQYTPSKVKRYTV